MANQVTRWDAIYAHPDFERLVKRRRSVVLRLLAISMVFFFSVPAIVLLQPDFFRIRFGGAANLGLIYLFAQYFVGTAVALRYAVLLSQLDAVIGSLCDVQAATPPAPRPTVRSVAVA